MIGGGLALNDTRFILVQATCPTILFASKRLRSTVPVGVQGMVLVPWFDFVRYFLRSPLVPSERAAPIGWLQPALAAPVGEEQ